LSAGVDSGAIVGLMRDAGQQDIRTVTLSFEEFAGSLNDEAPEAKAGFVRDFFDAWIRQVPEAAARPEG